MTGTSWPPIVAGRKSRLPLLASSDHELFILHRIVLSGHLDWRAEANVSGGRAHFDGVLASHHLPGAAVGIPDRQVSRIKGERSLYLSSSFQHRGLEKMLQLRRRFVRIRREG
eukprot:TRINITY_DN28467_c0_g1_i4.p1 TRINITY_DN28467_c0_g1~~TRINITY_DN28467_c0_g1_i4.p1  ORF type:complete len:113 (-),score=8.22 TRINITY_DN28467_c0_g1_i4:108-446(-)